MISANRLLRTFAPSSESIGKCHQDARGAPARAPFGTQSVGGVRSIARRTAGRLGLAAVSALVFFVSRTATAQEDAPTWTSNRTTPGRHELFAVDTTGEAQWPFGRESVLDNGNAFTAAEASIDLRTAYADTTSSELWLRAYTVGAPPANSLKGVFFLDIDHRASSGGSAAARVIDERFESDPTDGGYEYALFVPAAPAAPAELYQWLAQSSVWARADDQPTLVKTSGTDFDPIRFDSIRERRERRGYIQVRAPLDAVVLTQACEARIFVRGVDDAPDLEPGDLALGEPGDCVPPDANRNDVSDVEETGTGGGSGTDGGDRNGRFADAGTGNPDAITIADDEEVRGGACTCALARRTRSLFAALGVLGLGLASLLRRARRPSKPSAPRA